MGIYLISELLGGKIISFCVCELPSFKFKGNELKTKKPQEGKKKKPSIEKGR